MLQDMTYITFHCKYGQLSIHRGCIEQLGCPRYVQILINMETRQLLLRSATSDERDVFEVPESIYSVKATFNINGELLIRKFISLMNWQGNCAYRVDGILADGMMLFDMDTSSTVEDWREDITLQCEDRCAE